MYKEYRVSKIVVKKKNKGLYDYFANICDKARVLFNTTNFLIRQCMSALYKPSEEWQPLQRKAITLINTYIPKITEASENRCNIRRKNILENKKLSDEDKSARLEKLKPVEYAPMSENHKFPNYNILEGVLRLSENSDYRSMPSGVNQNTIKAVVWAWESFFELMSLWNKKDNSIKSKPHFPRYITGPTTVTFNNINCKFKKDSKNNTFIRFPKTHEKLNLGSYYTGDEKLIEVKVIPKDSYFIVAITTETEVNVNERNLDEDKNHQERVVSIDVGLKNIATITNNIGKPPILIKGNMIVGRNRTYLSRIAEEQSIITNGKKPGEKGYRGTDKRIRALYDKRDRMLYDYFHKVALFIVLYCTNNDIDTLVIGRNKGIKQNMDLGNKTQDFAYLPFERLYHNLKYLCSRHGIKYIEVEESYTSKASFFDHDVVPTYGNMSAYSQNNIPVFSGHRSTKDSEIYITGDGTVIHADVNGSLNIMRKYNEDATKNITIENVMFYETRGYYFFYKKRKNKLRPKNLDFHKIFANKEKMA